MIDTKEIQESLSFAGENSGEEPAKTATEVQDETGRGETQNDCMNRLRSSWQAVLIAILMALFCGVSGVLFTQIGKQQSLTAELQHMAEEILTARNNTKQLQIENQLKQLVNCTNQNFTLLGSEYGQLKLFINATLYNFTLLSAEKPQLSLLFKNTLQEKAQLQVENKEQNMLLNSTLENRNLVEEENRQLNLLLNESLHIITLASAESKRSHLLLNNERQTSMQPEAENQHQRSILFSDKLSFLWRFCNENTLQCSRCLPGWVQHTSRCFFLSQETKKWEDARRECLDMGGDLAVVVNAEDQAFLTNMTFQFVQQHPQEDFRSAWIVLQDVVKEGAHIWVNGNRIHSDVIYWKHPEPNNAVASWDKDRAGQDCVAIVPRRRTGQEDWLGSFPACSRFLNVTSSCLLSNHDHDDKRIKVIQ